MRYSVSEIVSMVAAGDTRPFYNHREWRKLSKKVIKNGNYDCCLCKERGKVSMAVLTHHVNELRLRPDLAYSLTYEDEHGNTHPQLIPICHDCHERIHKRGIYAETSGQIDDSKFWQEELW